MGRKSATDVDAAPASPVAIRPELAHLIINIGEITTWPGNPRQGDIATIRDSLADHGQYAPVLVQDSTGYVVKGNNTLRAMIELGATRIAAQRLDLTDGRARKILAIDNRSSDRATYDDAALVALLLELEDDLSGTGWEPAELDELLRSTDHLGDQATAFLNDLGDGADELSPPAPAPAPPADPVAAAAAPEPAETASLHTPDPPAPGAPPPPPVEYVTMSWTCLADQRDLVRAAIKRAQHAGGLSTAAEGLVAMAQHYLATVGEA